MANMAKQVGLAPEELARASLESWLEKPREDFESGVQYVLDKNRELYRRLA
jgi:hypothetical protein